MADNGGFAFPHWDPHDGSQGAVHNGMSLRDYFAGQALAGIMENSERWKQIAEDYKAKKKTYDQCSMANATKAYSLADAMLKARGEEGKDG